jgi:hypothetical protein
MYEVDVIEDLTITDKFEFIFEHILSKGKNKKGDTEVTTVIKSLLKDGMDKSYLFRKLLEQTSINKPPAARVALVDSIFKLTKPELFFVYKLYNKGKLLYIGSTKDLRSRLACHKTDKVFNRTEVTLCPDKYYMVRLENYLILNDLPPRNDVINLRLARDWCEELPKFIDVEDFNYEFFPSVGYLNGSNEDYLYRDFIFVKNINNIKPHWWKNK